MECYIVIAFAWQYSHKRKFVKYSYASHEVVLNVIYEHNNAMSIVGSSIHNWPVIYLYWGSKIHTIILQKGIW